MYTLSDSAFKLLRYDLNQILDSASHHQVSSTDAPFVKSSNYDVDSQINPHNFFHLQFQGKYTYVYKLKNTPSLPYTIVCEHFVPKSLRPYFEKTQSLDLYKHCFGAFWTLYDAVVAFSHVCADLFEFSLSNDVEFRQLEIF